VAGVAYGTAAAAGASGFLAVYVCGLIVGARVPRHRRGIRTFHEGLANIAEIGLFLLLGLLVFPSSLPTVGLTAMGVTAVLVLVARPFAVHATMAWPWLVRRDWNMRELGLVSWAGLRGAVPIVLATFPLTAQYPEGGEVFDIVFFVVLVSTAVQGSTIGLVARRLGLREGASIWAPIAETLPLEGVDVDLLEVDVTDQLHIAGRRLRDVPLPAGGLLTAVVRDGRTLVPTGDTLLLPGDRALVASPRHPRSSAQIVAWARGELPEPAEPF
jgi:cell volume regulation protein A